MEKREVRERYFSYVDAIVSCINNGTDAEDEVVKELLNAIFVLREMEGGI